jgi:hypothetical protein
MGKSFLPDDVNQSLLFPPSLHNWLPERHLARFLVDVVPALDPHAIYASYEAGDGRGQSAYAPVEIISASGINQSVWAFRVDPQTGDHLGSMRPIFKLDAPDGRAQPTSTTTIACRAKSSRRAFRRFGKLRPIWSSRRFSQESIHIIHKCVYYVISRWPRGD